MHRTNEGERSKILVVGLVFTICAACLIAVGWGIGSTQIDPNKHPHLDYGYAMTSHSSQGQTANRVLIHVDTELAAKDLLNTSMAYVSVSRGAFDAQLFTNDRDKLPIALGHDVSKQTAQVQQINAEQTIAPQQEISQAPQHDHGLGFGIGL